jgi:hypothetical protein
MYYPSGLAVAMVLGPALDVYFYFLEGDVLYYGTIGAVQIELKDRQGEYFNPVGDILMSIFGLDSIGAPIEPASVMGVASQEALESIPQCGRYYFEFDTGKIPPVADRVLVRASIPYNGGNVLWQRSIQLQDPDLVT